MKPQNKYIYFQWSIFVGQVSILQSRGLKIKCRVLAVLTNRWMKCLIMLLALSLEYDWIFCNGWVFKYKQGNNIIKYITAIFLYIVLTKNDDSTSIENYVRWHYYICITSINVYSGNSSQIEKYADFLYRLFKYNITSITKYWILL